jgi:carbon-monoxide dehydrogenase medium subunit
LIPGPFEYHRPGSVDEVVALLGKFGDDGRVIAGGHSLIPMMKLRLAVPDHIIDLRDVGGLNGIAEDGDTIVIGAMATQADVLASELLAAKCPIMPEAAALIADPQVRYVGTIGGNVANGDPGNDMPALMQCLDASYVLNGPNGEREVSARDYYEAAFFTKRSDDELMTAIRVPTPADGHGSAYEKLKRKTGDYATAAAAVVLSMQGGTCSAASIALTNVADTPLYAEAAGTALVGNALDEAAIGAAVAAAKEITAPASDLHGPAEYRTYVAGVMVRRAIERAAARAAG